MSRPFFIALLAAALAGCVETCGDFGQPCCQSGRGVTKVSSCAGAGVVCVQRTPADVGLCCRVVVGKAPICSSIPDAHTSPEVD